MKLLASAAAVALTGCRRVGPATPSRPIAREPSPALEIAVERTGGRLDRLSGWDVQRLLHEQSGSESNLLSAWESSLSKARR